MAVPAGCGALAGQSHAKKNELFWIKKNAHFQHKRTHLKPGVPPPLHPSPIGLFGLNRLASGQILMSRREPDTMRCNVSSSLAPERIVALCRESPVASRSASAARSPLCSSTNARRLELSKRRRNQQLCWAEMRGPFASTRCGLSSWAQVVTLLKRVDNWSSGGGGMGGCGVMMVGGAVRVRKGTLSGHATPPSLELGAAAGAPAHVWIQRGIHIWLQPACMGSNLDMQAMVATGCSRLMLRPSAQAQRVLNQRRQAGHGLAAAVDYLVLRSGRQSRGT